MYVIELIKECRPKSPEHWPALAETIGLVSVSRPLGYACDCLPCDKGRLTT